MTGQSTKFKISSTTKFIPARPIKTNATSPALASAPNTESVIRAFAKKVNIPRQNIPVLMIGQDAAETTAPRVRFLVDFVIIT